MTVDTADLMDSLDPVSLQELLTRAALQDRVDRKYLLSTPQLETLVEALGPVARVLQIEDRRSFDYASVYFDTPHLTCYLLAAHRRRRRFKIRTRTYLDSAECWLEVKTRDKRGHTVKYRQAHDADNPDELTPCGRLFTDQVVTDAAVPGAVDLSLAPTLVTSYRRSTLFLPATDSRVTIDTDLRWTLDTGVSVALPDMAIVETKNATRASQADRILWRNGCRPSQISKYGTGLAALRPELPSTKWHRVLHRHFPAITA
jgi:hypothetical protein